MALNKRFSAHAVSAVLACVGICLLAFPRSVGISAQLHQAVSRSDHFSVEASPNKIALLRMYPPNGVEANTYYWLSVTNDRVTTRPRMEIQFMVGSPSPTSAIYRHWTSDHFLYAISLSGGSASFVATVWNTGSAIRTCVYEISLAGVQVLIDQSTHLPPEFTLGSILINTGWVPVGDRCCTADKTEVWRWNGDIYRLVATVPFRDRYVALAKLENGAKER